MITGGALALIIDGSKGIKKRLEDIGEKIRANYYLLKRKLNKTRELNFDSLNFSYME